MGTVFNQRKHTNLSISSRFADYVYLDCAFLFRRFVVYFHWEGRKKKTGLQIFFALLHMSVLYTSAQLMYNNCIILSHVFSFFLLHWNIIICMYVGHRLRDAARPPRVVLHISSRDRHIEKNNQKALKLDTLREQPAWRQHQASQKITQVTLYYLNKWRAMVSTEWDIHTDNMLQFSAKIRDTTRNTTEQYLQWNDTLKLDECYGNAQENSMGKWETC